MANPLLLDIISFLTEQGIVEGDGIDAFRDFTPEAPDALVALHEYPGDHAVQHEAAVHRSVQISARAKKPNDARQKAVEIFYALRTDNLIVHFTPDRWGQVYLRQPPFKMRVDESGRTYYGFNVGITTTID